MSPNLKALARELTDAADSLLDSLDDVNSDQRKRIFALTDQIRSEVERPNDRVNTYNEYIMEMAALRVFMDWDAFTHIPEDPEGISYAELAAKLDAEESLIRRLGWALALRDILKPVGLDRVAHTKLSREFAKKDGWGARFRILYEGRNRVSSRWREFFAKYGRKAPVNISHGNPTSFAFGKDEMSHWDILDASTLPDFNASMRLISQFRTPPDIFPWRWIAENAHLVAPDTALVVDVGGGFGHDLHIMRKECPDIPAERMVLQDRPDTIKEVERLNSPEVQGMQKMAHDFFTEQPIKGALLYFFKRIMHDWSDKYCLQILGRTRDVMSPESRILIYDYVMPQPPTYNVVVSDLAMMNLSSKQRTEKDWKKLVASAGLELVRIWEDQTGRQDGVIECKRMRNGD